MGARWLLRETLFVVIGAALWAAFGWRLLVGVVVLALVVNLLWLRSHRVTKR